MIWVDRYLKDYTIFAFIEVGNIISELKDQMFLIGSEILLSTNKDQANETIFIIRHGTDPIRSQRVLTEQEQGGVENE